MPLFRRRGASRPGSLRQAVPLAHGEQLLAWAPDDAGAGQVVATTHTLALVAGDGQLVWRRPWYEVDIATWHPDSDRLTVLWADGQATADWVIHDAGLFKQALRERVQASVVLSEEFHTDTRRRVRVAIRQDLATGRLIEQIIGGRGTDLSDPAIRAEAEKRLRVLRSEVGR